MILQETHIYRKNRPESAGRYSYIQEKRRMDALRFA